MKFAVCVKYVPVVARIQFDYENKKIVREGVPSEVNAFDMLGIVRAAELKQSPDDEVVVVCMGPPQAKDGLLECLALGGDRAILLTDRALAGSDTLATARALSMVLEREQPDLILCGRNSSDAETGQVGPGIAELMGMPHVGPVSRLDLEPESRSVLVQRIIDQGHQVIRCPLPALVCVTDGVAPESFPDRDQMAEAATKPLEEVSCAQLIEGTAGDMSLFGEPGSPTWVQDIRLVEPNRMSVTIQGEDPAAAAQQMAQGLKERLAEMAAQDGAGSAAVESTRYPDGTDRSIWVVADTFGSDLLNVTLEMLGKARQLTAITRSEVVAVAVTPHGHAMAADLAAYGADRVLVLDNSELGPVYGRAVSEAMATAISDARPYAVLFAASADGRDLAARIAANLKLGLTGDAVDLEIDDEGRLVQLKPALGGNVVAPILSKTLPNLVTLRPGLLTPITPEPAAQAAVETIQPRGFQGVDIEVIEEQYQEDIGATELIQAQVVIGLGMGVGGPEELPQLREMARSIGATVATTRNVVHSGWLPHQIQVGISGRSIAPKVYLAVGIRGAFNHTVGIQKAGVILAINSNRRAAIFRSADYGVVGDWKEYLPPLLEAIKPVLADLSGASGA